VGDKIYEKEKQAFPIIQCIAFGTMTKIKRENQKCL